MTTQETAPTRFLEANGTQYAYRVIGANASASPPLLMLNHFRSNIDLWDPTLINNLTASGRQVVTYDYAGHGHSGGEVATSITGFANNLIGFLHVLLAMLKVKQVDVLGFSLGGYVAQQTVLIEPDLIGKLILSGTGPSLGPDLMRPMAEIQSAIMAPVPSGPPTIAAFFPAVAADEGEAWLNRSFAGRANIAGKNGEPAAASFLTGPGVARLVEAYLKWDADPVPYALLQTIQKDVLVTAGQNDLIVPNRNAWVLAHQLPRAVRAKLLRSHENMLTHPCIQNFVQYPTSGHGHIFQYSGLFAKQVLDFLDQKWPTSPFSAGPINSPQ
jgi:pimeloyl-ACP methyl ester carboxylesterase